MGFIVSRRFAQTSCDAERNGIAIMSFAQSNEQSIAVKCEYVRCAYIVCKTNSISRILQTLGEIPICFHGGEQ